MAKIIVESPVWRLQLQARTQDDLVAIVEEIADDCRRGAPVKDGALVASIHTAFAPGRGYVFVGTDHWAPTEYGSLPHQIPTHPGVPPRGGPLRFFWEKVGRWVVFRKVNHPGTPAQPFMRPALYRRRSLRGGWGKSRMPKALQSGKP